MNPYVWGLLLFLAAPRTSWVRDLLKIIAYATSWLVRIQACIPGIPSVHDQIILFGNPSMTGTFIATALIGTDVEAAAWMTAILIGRSTPLLVLATHWCLRKDSWLRINLALIVCWFLVLLKGLPTGNGRFAIWKLYFNWWKGLDPASVWTGVGLGKTPFWLSQVRLLDVVKNHEAITTPGLFFLHVHNDFLEALVDLGIAGVGLLAVLGIYLVWNAPREKRAKGAALLVGMATNFPWHALPHMFVYWVWVKEELCRLNQKLNVKNSIKW